MERKRKLFFSLSYTHTHTHTDIHGGGVEKERNGKSTTL